MTYKNTSNKQMKEERKMVQDVNEKVTNVDENHGKERKILKNSN